MRVPVVVRILNCSDLSFRNKINQIVCRPDRQVEICFGGVLATGGRDWKILTACRGGLGSEYQSNISSGSRETKALHDTIRRMEAKNSKSNVLMLALTAIAAVAAVIAAVPVVQGWVQ